MVGKQAEAQQAAQGMSDRDALHQYLQSGGDIYTPTGIEKAMTDLRGRISPDTYLKLGEQARALKTADVSLKEKLSQYNTEQLAAYDAGIERTMPMLANLSSGYEKVKAEKGEQAAGQWFQEQRSQLIPQLQGQQIAPGMPMFNPQVLQTVGQMNPEQLPALISGSKYHAAQVKSALDEAKAKEAAAKAKVYEETGGLKPGQVDLYADSQGNKYEVTRMPNGRTTVVRNGTDRIGLEDLPSDVKKLGSKAASDAAGAALLKPETLQFMADYTSVTGRAFPVPSVGAANNQARAMYLNAAADLAKSRGYDGTEAGGLALQRDATKEALKRMTTQTAVIEAGEKDMENVMTVLKDELKKLGGPDSPKVRALWNKGATEWAGDPDFTGVNAAWANFQETAARVFSGQTGAGGTPVNYLRLVQDSVGKNPNLEQIYKLDDTMGKLFAARKKATQGVQKALVESAKMPAKPGSAAAVSAGEQAERDKSSQEVIRSEYDKAVAAVKAAKTPEERSRALSDARSTRAELKRMGVDVPDVTTEQATTPASAGGKKSYSSLWQ